MKTILTHTMELSGTNYDIGYQLGIHNAGIPSLKNLHTTPLDGFGATQVQEATAMFDRWCPGLTEELAGFADALGVSTDTVFYYGMTYLIPRCSQIAVLPRVSAAGIPLLARNYEFSSEAEDFCFVKTAVRGKYTHMGTSAVQFGRDDGVNEHGLAVSMSSCGFPVGPLPYMRAPRLKGLQFWAVIRALLENCKNVQEALAYLDDMPIAYNINLMLVDKHGAAALYETLNGACQTKQVDAQTPAQTLWATNHPVMPELIPLEPKAMVHSTVRYAYIGEQLHGKTAINSEMLKEMLLSNYPTGLCCHYDAAFFGTTKSMIISPARGTIELCWGGNLENGWRTYTLGEPLANATIPITLRNETVDPAIFDDQAL